MSIAFRVRCSSFGTFSETGRSTAVVRLQLRPFRLNPITQCRPLEVSSGARNGFSVLKHHQVGPTLSINALIYLQRGGTAILHEHFEFTRRPRPQAGHKHRRVLGAVIVQQDRDKPRIEHAGTLEPRRDRGYPSRGTRVSLLLAQGAEYSLVVPSSQDDYVRNACPAGEDIDYRVYAGHDHVPLVQTDSRLIPEFFGWTAKRFAGDLVKAGTSNTAHKRCRPRGVRPEAEVPRPAARVGRRVDSAHPLRTTERGRMESNRC